MPRVFYILVTAWLLAAAAGCETTVPRESDGAAGMGENGGAAGGPAGTGVNPEADTGNVYGQDCDFSVALEFNDPNVINVSQYPGCPGDWVCGYEGTVGRFDRALGSCRGAGEMYALCATDAECNTGLRCFIQRSIKDQPKDTPTGYCFDFGIPLICSFSGSQHFDDPTSYGECAAESWQCGRNGQCQTSSAPGTACLFDKDSYDGDLWSNCGDGYVCGSENVCVVAGVVGGHCGQNEDCDSLTCGPLGQCLGKECSFVLAMHDAVATGGGPCTDPSNPCGITGRCQPKNRYGSFCTSGEECRSVGKCAPSKRHPKKVGGCVAIVPTKWNSTACRGDKHAVGWSPSAAQYTCVEPGKAYSLCTHDDDCFGGTCYTQRTDTSAPDGQENLSYCAPFPDAKDRYGACKFLSTPCHDAKQGAHEVDLTCAWLPAAGQLMPHPVCAACDSENPTDLAACKHTNDEHLGLIVLEIGGIVFGAYVVLGVLIAAVVTFPWDLSALPVVVAITDAVASGASAAADAVATARQIWELGMFALEMSEELGPLLGPSSLLHVPSDGADGAGGAGGAGERAR